MSPSVKLAVGSIQGPLESLKQCTPNLMPFHIDYTGPASVTTFMRVEKLAGKQAESSPVKSGGEDDEKRKDDIAMDVDSSVPVSEDIGSGTISADASSTGDIRASPILPTLARTATETTLATEASQTTLDSSTLTSIASHSSTSQTQLGAPPIEDLDKRFVSTFRGRSIHGLTLDLPKGYTGLVLKANKDLVNEASNVRKQGGRSRENINDVEAEMDIEMEIRRPRRKGRLTSSAAPRKDTVITISDDDDAAQPANSIDIIESSKVFAVPDSMDMADSILSSDGPCRVLIPSARFDSFTLWQTDRMVDKTSDEYWRALTEWIGIAHEIHRTD